MTARRIGTIAAVALVVLVLLTSHRLGRAEPTGEYRPALAPDGLAAGCFPLPDGVRFGFRYQIRRDGDFFVDGEPRRVLQGQYVEIDETEARASLVADFAAAGYVESGRPPPYDVVLRRPGTRPDEAVRVIVRQLPGIEDDSLVRGRFALVLPVVPDDPDAPDVCDDESVTKRFDIVTWLLGW